MSPRGLVIPAPGSTWKHYKGSLYEVLHLGTNEADGEPVVIYRGTQTRGTNRIWVRPVADWAVPVKTTNDEIVQRFTQVRPQKRTLTYPPGKKP